MRLLLAGEYIREEREKQKLKQSELCDGICSRVTISRIESGNQMPNIRTMQALLERLGLPGEKFYAILSEEEERAESLKEMITSCVIHGDREHGLDYLGELEAIADKKDKLLGQNILHYRALLGKREGPWSCEERKGMLLQAIQMTVPCFSADNVFGHRYCLEELQLIIGIAQTYSADGQHKKALDLYEQCCKYTEKYNQNIIRCAGLLPFAALNYAVELGKCGFYREALEYAEKGRQYCIKYGHYQFLPELIHTKAETYHLMGDDENGKKLTIYAWSLYNILDDEDNRAGLARDAKKYYGMKLV